MHGLFESGNVVIPVVEDDEYTVVAEELAKILSLLVVIDTLHVGIPPYGSSSERRTSLRNKLNLLHIGFGKQVALHPTSLDGCLGKVTFEVDNLRIAKFRLDEHLDDFGLTILVGAEIGDARTLLALRDVIDLIAHHRSDGKALDHMRATLAVAIDDIIDGAIVVLAIDVEIKHVLADIDLLIDLHHLVLTGLIDDKDFVNLRAVADKFRFGLLETCADESLGLVEPKFHIRLDDLGGIDRIEVAYLGVTRIVGAILLLEVLEPLDGIGGQVLEVSFHLLNLLLGQQDVFLGLLAVELVDTSHLDILQSQQVVAGNFAHKVLLERFEPHIDVCEGSIEVLGLLVFLALVDAFLDEDLFERTRHQMFQ